MSLLQNWIHTLHQHTDDTIRIIRFTVGVTLAVAIAFWFNWPLAFITPVFVTKFLGNRAAKVPFKALLSIMLVCTAAFIAGILVTRFLLPFPVVFILIMTLIIFGISYWGYSGVNDIVITMLLVGFTIVPMLGLLHQQVASVVTISFLFSCFMALLITMVIHEIVPDKTNVKSEQKKQKMDITSKEIRFQLALLSTIIIMPVLIFFFYFSLTDAILVLIFVAILAQKPDLLMGMQGTKALLVGNTLGGIFAIIMFNVLTIAPTYLFLILVFSFVNIYFARLVFSSSPLSPIYAMALTTIIVLISMGSLGEANTGEKFYTRIFQIACACGYVIFATYISSPWLSEIKNKYIQTTDNT
ncbi:DUF2955 domain-containing protein [Thalassotalea crassostreae]|uniref:DUF2955 domain-containing protein n=1 Tax=Thalassotalea crassostreae TaxID=1763536 RepID=UPI0008388309|nr:DUF2955 domain-containing protein [Thalassotalea crassostreae]